MKNDLDEISDRDFIIFIVHVRSALQQHVIRHTLVLLKVSYTLHSVYHFIIRLFLTGCQENCLGTDMHRTRKETY